VGKTKGPMQQEFPSGSLVRIANQEKLEEFRRTWTLHHRLQPEQLQYAGQIGKVVFHGFYHGGDELYKVEGIPGIWHEQCLDLYAP
jgi:hypothetical protein